MPLEPAKELEIVRQAGRLLSELTTLKRQVVGRHNNDLENRMRRLEHYLLNIITGKEHQEDNLCERLTQLRLAGALSQSG